MQLSAANIRESFKIGRRDRKGVQSSQVLRLQILALSHGQNSEVTGIPSL
jgi:hypothetical protein